MKILHTADWQIGMRAAHAGERAPEVREARLRAAERVVDEAAARGVDLLLLAGDTFEDSSVEPILIRRVVDVLARAPCPVFVLPGNHDPLGPGSVFRHAAWSEARPRVRVLDEAAPVDVGGGAVLLPSPCTARASTEDPTLRLPAGDPSKIRIGVAHGSLRGCGFEVEPDDFPIAADAAERAGVDYLALGHWHSTLVLPRADAARVAYPGTHETTKFGERASGCALEVTLDGPGRPARTEVIPTGTLAWIDRAATLVCDDDVAHLRTELDALPAPERTLVRLVLDGVVSETGAQALEILEETLRARFLSVRVERRAIEPRPDDAAAWLRALPDGVARRVAERLLADCAAEGDAARRELAMEALVRLTAMARRAQP